jgi:hypothetical protein
MSNDFDAYIAEQARRQAELRRHLATLPVETVTGLVGPLGSAYTRLAGEKHRDLVFTLTAWRTENGRSEPIPLRVAGPVTPMALIRRFLPPAAKEIVRLRVHLGEDADGNPQALLAGFTGRWMRDRRMVIERISQRRPVVVEDPVLGPLTLNRQTGQFAGRADWLGAPIAITLATDHGLAWDKGAAWNQATAHALFADQAGWTERLKEKAAADLLATHNDAWVEDSTAPLTADQFKARLTLKSLTCWGNREFVAGFDDGGLFWGHGVQVDGEVEKGPTGAVIGG